MTGDFSTFWDMGGYAAYVWPAYGLAVALFIGLAASSWRQVKQAEAKLSALQEQGDDEA